MFTVGIVGGIGFLLSLFLTKMLINSAQKIGMVDLPSYRNSHVMPIPRGGGLIFSIVFKLYGLAVMVMLSYLPFILLGQCYKVGRP